LRILARRVAMGSNLFGSRAERLDGLPRGPRPSWLRRFPKYFDKKSRHRTDTTTVANSLLRSGREGVLDNITRSSGRAGPGLPRSGRRLAQAAALLAGLGLGAGNANAASLQAVSSWGASGVPSYISMYIYVPDKLATDPPILVVNHYCGGNASGVFGEAQGGGIVSAADKYGFIMIFPQTSNNCWDVGSTKSLTHDGGGDTQAIAQMVKYTLTKYTANPDRVYATGTSSGAMMTEALMAVYPDVFKGGAEFSGVPAGCWSASYSASNQWSGPCAGGMVSHTAQEWGDQARAMDKSFTGHRPRVQLWHGQADPTINFNNQTEAIKEWTNVLGLSSTATTSSTVTIGSHQWMRQSWASTCGYTVLDVWSEPNGPHGTDANLNATYVIPFLALDKAGDVDPEITACGGGAGGATGAGGGAGNPDAGTDASDGGGARNASDGAAGHGGGAGTIGSGGVSATGGTGGQAAGSGGASAGTGGVTSSGGMTASGSGGRGSGGALASSGGVTGSGGVANPGSGGSTTMQGSGGVSASGGAPSDGATGGGSSGCSCGVTDAGAGTPSALSLLLGFALLMRSRRRGERRR